MYKISSNTVNFELVYIICLITDTNIISVWFLSGNLNIQTAQFC